MITIDRGTVDGILDSINLSIARGERLALVGPNGAGKSTLLSVLAGLRPLDHGTMATRGGPHRIGLLLQEPDNQLVTSSVRHELLLSVPAGDGEAARWVADAVERFGLVGMEGRHPRHLSGGEKQRLALATVWLQRPDLVLLDEPTSFLDPPSAARCRAFVRGAGEEGATVVWAGPMPDEVDDGRVVCLDAGAVAFDGPAAAWEVSEHRAAYRFPEPGRSDALPTRPGGPPALEFEDVSFAYDGRPVFEGLNVAVSPGECLGVAGNNGSGKSTLLHLAGGVVTPSRGRITLRIERERGRQTVFLLSQSPERMFFAERVADEITFGLRRLGVEAGVARHRAGEALERAGLDPSRILDRQPFDLSYGEMRRVAFAVADALRPSLLLLDEPTAGLDPAGVTLFFRLLDEYRAAGTTVLVASHDPRALSACDRVVRLDDPAGSDH